MILAHKIALDPTYKQRKAFAMAAGCARFAYNWGLSWWKTTYQAGGKPTALRAKKAFNQIKAKEFPWIYLSPKDANQDAFTNLGLAFTRFFKKQNKFPTFKTRKHGSSFGVSNDKFRIEDNYIRLPKIGWVRMFENLRFSGKIMSATVSRIADRWFVSVQVDIPIPTTLARTKQSIVGIDLGLTNAIVVSDGSVFNAPKPLKVHLRKLKMLQRSLARKKKGSNRRRKAQLKVARLYARIANIRNDFIHKVTTELVKKHSVICIEDLHVKGMLKNHKLARALSDVGFGEIRRQLAYKSKMIGVKLVLADRWFSSTQTCSRCGSVRKVKLGLGDRQFKCEDCRFECNRDLNAAKNLSTLGLRGSDAQGHFVSPLACIVKAGMDELRTNQCSLVNTI